MAGFTGKDDLDGTTTEATEGLEIESGAKKSQELCLFHAYTNGCFKERDCEYCHMPQSAAAPVELAQKIRPKARGRIQHRVLQYLVMDNLYAVHHELQEEARKSPYALRLIKMHLEASRSLPSTRGVQKVVFSL